MLLWNFKIKFPYTTIPWGSTVMEAGQQSSSCRISYDSERLTALEALVESWCTLQGSC